jgi:hypothetical protein
MTQKFVVVFLLFILTHVGFSQNYYVLSIGFNSENSSNSESDAKRFAGILREKYKDKVYSFLLIGEDAAEHKILDTLDKIKRLATEKDFFIFNYSGTNRDSKTKMDSELTLFNGSISIKELTSNWDFIKATNQLIQIEPSNGAILNYIYKSSILENEQLYLQLTSRNRVLITPNHKGLAATECVHMEDSENVGPLVYFLEKALKYQSLEDLFSDDIEFRSNFLYHYYKIQSECHLMAEYILYTKIEFERDLLNEKIYYYQNLENERKATLEKIKKEIDNTNKYAYFFAVDQYNKPLKGKKTWNNLSNPSKDADSIARRLKKMGYHCKVLKNPTPDSIYCILQEIAEKVKSKDQLLIYFTGHGHIDTLFSDVFFIPTNGPHPDYANPINEYISVSMINRFLSNLEINQKMLFYDFCHSGKSIDESAKQTIQLNELMTVGTKSNNEPALNDLTEYRDVRDKMFVSNMLSDKSTVMITSGFGKVPDGHRDLNSPFCHRILKFLDSNKFAYLTSTDLFVFLRKLPSSPRMLQIQGNQSEFLFFFPQ